MKRLVLSLLAVAFASLLGACDLRPKIIAIPDSVGDFIAARYPALLADPDTQPEIYNSAVTDYGVYASGELYGTSTNDDYVLYSSVDDYVMPAVITEEKSNADIETSEIVPDDVEVPVAADEEETYIEDTETEDIILSDTGARDYIIVPEYVPEPPVPQTESPMSEITVVKGDTLYALARVHNTTPEMLADENNLKSPYALKIGQKLRLPSPNKKDAIVQNKPVEQKVKTPEKREQPQVQKLPKSRPQPKAQIVQQPEKTAVSPQPVSQKPAQTKVRIPLQDVTVASGDTLYSLSREYSVPVNDLAVLNDLSAPFTLRPGQKIKVPKLKTSDVKVADKTVSTKTTKKPEPQQVKKTETKPKPAVQKSDSTKINEAKAQNTKANPKSETKTVKKDSEKTKTQSASQPKKSQVKEKSAPAEKQRISSDPKKQLPKIAARSSSKFSWPVRGKILSHFGSKTTGLFNDGINIGAAHGTNVLAAENGVVAYAGNEVKGMGNLVIIQHSGGWMTVYAHMDSMSVKRGTQVKVGQKIGTVGTTGKINKPQLHFEIRKGTRAYNPVTYLKK